LNKCEGGIGKENIGSQADQSSKLHPNFANKPSEQQQECEECVAAENVGSSADKSTKLDPVLEKRLSEQLNACESGMRIEDIGSVTEKCDARLSEQCAECLESIAVDGFGPVAEQSIAQGPVLLTDVIDMIHQERRIHGTEVDDAANADVYLQAVCPARMAQPIPAFESKFRWMWGDAGVRPVPLSTRLAKRNPLRWSRLQITQEMITSLQSVCAGAVPPNECMRPVRLEVRRQGRSEVLLFANIAEALSYLSDTTV
jgi:hypothetical protein